MKRCPQCEFIYEDDQSLCDMDGVLLVFDSRTLPNIHALATVSGPIPEKTARRSRMVPAFATLILLLTVGSVYYVSTVRNVAQIDYSPASVTSTTTEAPAVVPPASADEPNAAQAAMPAPSVEVTTKEAEEVRQTHAAAPVSAAKPAAVTAKKTTTPGKSEPKKDDSKVESILKKTGKILKKPFKF